MTVAPSFPIRKSSGAVFSGFSTGVKMMLILVGALLPLGLIALFASLESAHANRATRNAATRLLATDSGRLVDATIARTAITLRAATTALAESGDPNSCRRTIESLAATHRLPVGFAIFAPNGEMLCATDSFMPRFPDSPGDDMRAELTPDGQALKVIVGAAGGSSIGVAQLSRAAIVAVSHPHAFDGSYRLALLQGDRVMPLASESGSTMLRRGITNDVPVADGQLDLRMTTIETPVTAVDALLVLLPILMLVAAASIGWLVVDRLVLRPLQQLHGAVSAYRAGDRRLALPALTTPSVEIRMLGEAFRGVAETISQHERELEAGLERQTKLTREVHHRVKNNLQVVASLLNIHARGAASSDAANAYASIQRRVDALAVVHRNHFAEMEENHGVALRSLIGELAANLRANAPPAAAAMPIRVDIEAVHVTQDVAVPIAFMITELVEAAMLSPRPAALTIVVRPCPQQLRATLAIASIGLTDAARQVEPGDRVGRIVEGLARQLRSKVARDDESGCVSTEFAILEAAT